MNENKNDKAFKPFSDITCPNCKKKFPAKTLSVRVQVLTGKVISIRRLDINKKFQFKAKGYMGLNSIAKSQCLCCGTVYPMKNEGVKLEERSLA